MSVKIGVAIVSDHKAGNLSIVETFRVSLLGVRENVCRACNTSYDVYANFK